MTPSTELPTEAGLQGQCIVSLALEDWHSTWRSRHHLLSRLARENDVLYCTAPVYSHAVREAWNKGPDRRATVETVAPRIVAYRPPFWIPQIHRAGLLQKYLRKTLVMHLRSVLRAQGWRPTVLYVWHPTFADLVDEFADCTLVYHCYDEYASFERDERLRQSVLEAEQKLLGRAAVAFTASEALKQRRVAHNARIHAVSNGVDYELFAQAADESLPVPPDAADIPGPVVGFVTTLTTITDLTLLHDLFSRRPDWSFVFIGLEFDAPPDADSALGRLLALPNIHLIGRRRLDEIPGYLKRCDILAIPWLVNEISLSGSPLKLYEYLASGKPVVSTPLTHLSHLAGVIEFAADATAWEKAIERALDGRSPGSKSQRQAVARDNTWDAKAAEVSRQLCAVMLSAT